MARSLGSTINSYLAGRSHIRISMIEIETSTGTVYYTDGPFSVSYAGNTYLAQGTFLSVTDTEENTDLVITNCSINISALDPANITKFATSANVNKSVTVMGTYLDPTDNSIVGTPIITFKGKITGYTVSNARNTGKINLAVASNFADFEKINGRRTNEGSWQKLYPGDRTMEFAHQTIEDINWGKP